QRLHALRLRDLAQLRGGRRLEDRVAQLLGYRHHLVEGDAAFHPGEVADLTALALVERDLAQARRHVAVRDEGVLVRLVGLLAVLADLAAQALGEDQLERRRDQERRNP